MQIALAFFVVHRFKPGLFNTKHQKCSFITLTVDVVNGHFELVAPPLGQAGRALTGGVEVNDLKPEV
ncbi:hypothetical protein BH09BAC4_BH09BAC4_51570 [soil metagenome]